MVKEAIDHKNEIPKQGLSIYIIVTHVGIIVCGGFSVG